MKVFGNHRTVALIAIGMLAELAFGQTPMGTGFTYQGQLKQAGNVYNGDADMLFELFDDSEAGNSVGVQEITAVPVTNGLFTVELNAAGEMGASAFNGDARWLQITIDDTELSPRQPVTAAPYALQTRGIFTSPNGNVTVPGSLAVESGSFSLSNPNNPSANLRTHWDGDINRWHFRTSGSGQGAIHGFQFSKQGTRTFGIDQNGNATAYGILRGSTDASDEWTEIGHGGSHGYINTVGDGNLDFRHDSATLMSLAHSGNLGIGNADPQASFHLENLTTIDEFVASDGIGSRFGNNLSETSTLIDPSRPGARMTVLPESSSGREIIFEKRPVGNNGPFEVFSRIGTAESFFLSKEVGFGMNQPNANIDILEDSPSKNARIQLRHADGLTWELSSNRGGIGELSAAFQLVDRSNGVARLTVLGNGTTRVKVLQITGGSDIAEPFNVNEPQSLTEKDRATRIKPGMVVAIDPTRVGELRVSDTPYDPTVAGIISGAGGVDPGMMLTQKGTVADGEHPVALTGRVWAYCDADAGGAIHPGDLLTSSGTRGHAMKSTDPQRAQGAIIGKAMSALEGGKGLVLVLVSLQ